MTLPDKPWPTGSVEHVAPMVARLLAPNSSLFTYTGTQTYLVGDDAGLAVIDPGPADETHLSALRAAIGSAPLLAIACTHTHRDHSPAAAPLSAATGAPIIGCAPIRTLDRPGADAERSDAPFDTAYAPDHVLSDGERIAGHGWSLEAVATPGHTSNHLCFALDDGSGDSGALFSGDHVMGWSTTVVVPPDGDMAEYMASLAKLQAREDRIFYPAHGPAIERPGKLLRGLMGHRLQRERQILKLLTQDSSTIEALVPRMYAGVDKVLWPAAGQSVLAHLLDLERRGRVARSGDLWTITD